jgi:hypothetical protein
LSHIIFTDEGAGKLRVRWDDDDYLGIYKWDDESLVISFRYAPFGRATAFENGKGQYLFILHRVKPGK